MDTGDLLLSKAFLERCSHLYGVTPRTLENNGQAFVSKHFNVIDPLRTNNNLGRSVSKGNYQPTRKSLIEADESSRVHACWFLPFASDAIQLRLCLLGIAGPKPG